jgi:hypothetical protein
MEFLLADRGFMRTLLGFLLMLWMGADVFAANGTLSGSGTKADPWLVEDYEDLKMVGKENYTLEGAYLLTADIDASASAAENCAAGVCAGFTPIGKDHYNFKGVFYGGGHSITGLTIYRPEETYVGLFGYILKTQIDSLSLVNVDITGLDYVGGLAGAIDAGDVIDVNISGSIKGNKNVGGLLGYIEYVYITDVSAECTVKGYRHVGGLIGFVDSGALLYASAQGIVEGTSEVGGLVGLFSGIATMYDSFSKSTVTGVTLVGGLVGVNSSSNIIRSYSISNVSGRSSVGGLIGHALCGTVHLSFSKGLVNGGMDVGGLIGSVNNSNRVCDDYSTPRLGIVNSYSTATVIGDSIVGGLIGYNIGTVKKVYAAGRVEGGSIVGGLIGLTSTSVDSSYWDMQTSLQIKDSYAMGLSTAEMMRQKSFDNWDFDSIWHIVDNKTYPYLFADTNIVNPPNSEDTASIFLLGSGTVNDPYLIFNYSNLKMIGSGIYFLGASYRLMADINASSSAKENCDSSGACSGFLPIGNKHTSFSGVFDGGQHTISNLKIYRPSSDYVGLFGNVDSGAIIRELGLINANIYGNACVGGFAGKNNGLIEKSFVNGSVMGQEAVGGGVGQNSGEITNSYSSANVFGGEKTGGLVGYFESGIMNASYSTGVIEGDSLLGGLIGIYNAGSIISSYWDYEVSGVDSSAGGVGYTSHGMTKAANFVNWDFATIWNIVADSTYPYFSWSQQIVYPVLVDSSKLILSGTGTAKDPFLIEDYEDLKVVGFGPYVLSSHFRVVADIDASASARENCNAKGVCSGFLPIGIDSSIRFSGTFDGGGCEIKNLLINNISSIYAGLFWTIDTIGVVDSLGIRNLVLKGSTVGSIAGLNLGTISNSYAADSVTGNASSGGLVGINKGSIFNSSFAGNITGSAYIGGLVGENSGHVSKSFANASVEATDSYAGGLMGLNTGILSNSFATGSVDGPAYSGGLVGDNRGLIDSSYSTASVTGSSFIGGLLGSNTSTVTNTYASGIVTGGTNVGGLIGKNTGAVDSSYAVGSVVGSSMYVGGLIGVSDSSVTNSYAEGSVTGGSYVGGLVGENDGSVKFSHAIGLVTGTGWKVGGLIGINNDSIFNTYATGNVSGEEYVGGLVGDNSGFVENSYARGNISKGFRLGGFVGYNSGIVNNCYTTGSVKGTFTMGGFVSINVRTIINSYSTGDVFGEENVGSFVGSQSGDQYGAPSILNSYSLGRVVGIMDINGFIGYNKNSTITSSYWNIDLYPSDTTYLAKGLTTTEMLQQSSYANWNFDTDWNMVSDSTYPYLRGMQNAAFALNDSLNFTISIPSSDSLVAGLLKNDYVPEITDAKLTVRFDSTSEILLSTLNRDTLTIGDTFTLYYQVGYISALDTLWGSHASAIISLKPEEPRVGSSMDVLLASDIHIHLSNQIAEVRYVIPSAGVVNLFLFDLQGHRVQSFAFGNQSLGEHSTTVDLSILPRGRYFAVLTLNGHILQNLPLILTLGSL